MAENRFAKYATGDAPVPVNRFAKYATPTQPDEAQPEAAPAAPQLDARALAADAVVKKEGEDFKVQEMTIKAGTAKKKG